MRRMPAARSDTGPSPDPRRPTPPENQRETMRIVSALERAGDLLELQLLFVAFSIAIVSIVPSAVALQRSARSSRLDAGGLAKRFLAEFAGAWKTCWIAGLVVPMTSAAGAASVLLWSMAPAPAAALGLGLLIPLALAAGATYLAYIGTAGTMAEGTTAGKLASDSLRALFARPVPAFAASLALGAWLTLVVRIPTLGLVGSGLVPAALAWIAVRPRVPSNRETPA